MNELKQKFFAHLAQVSDAPPAIEVAYAQGCNVYDTSGKEYIDCISGISVSALGHHHPRIIAAIQQQLHRHLHVMVYGEYIFESQVLMAEKLKQLLPSTLNCVYFTNSGAEAIEGAIKLARRYTGRSKLISCYYSYHGSTTGALSITGNPDYQRAFRPLMPDVFFIHYNHTDSLHFIDNQTAAVFVEPVQSESGYIPANKEFLQQLRERCHKTGALLVFDEAQTGFCRTGKMFAFEHYEVIPDVLVLAKAIGGGLPLGAFIADSSLMQVFKHRPSLGHLTTFGGHPLSCAAGCEFIDILIEEDIAQKVQHHAAILRKGLTEIFSHAAISGLGLLLAIHLPDVKTCKQFITRALQKGLLIDSFLFAPQAIRIAPPLIIDETLIERILRIFEEIAKEK